MNLFFYYTLGTYEGGYVKFGDTVILRNRRYIKDGGVQMKKFLSICLGLFLLFTSLSPVLINPSTALGAESGQARVVSTVGDGLRYYVVFEYNGTQYRSDQMGSAFNANMWNMLNETDRRTVSRNYAFAPAYRADQFGSAGSQAMVDWKNEVSGWKAAGEAWEAAIGAREYPELAALFTGNGYNTLMVGDKSLNDVKSELGNFSVEVKQSSQYEAALQLTRDIDQKYAAGQAIYGKLADIKAKQVGNAFKAGSEILIKDIIIDNIMIPAITPSASKVSEAIAECIFFLKDRAVDMYGKLREDPDVGEVLAIMQEMLDILERTDKAIINEINSQLGQLSSSMETLRILEQQKEEEKEQLIKQKETALAENVAAAFDWSTEAVNYGIPAPDEEMTEEEIAAKRTQVESEATSIKSGFEGILAEVLQRKHDIYALLDYDDGGALTNHPTAEQKIIENNLWVSCYAVAPYGAIDLTTPIDPAAYFSYYHPYSETKSVIDSSGQDLVDNWDKSIELLQQYIQDVEALIADETLRAQFDSVEQEINGLESVYVAYVGGDLKSYVLNGISYGTIQSNLESMLTTGWWENDYQLLAGMEGQQTIIEKNIDDFQTESALFESELKAAAAGYDSLYTNLQNSATFMVGAYVSLKNLYKTSPYFTYYNPENYGENMPIVNEDYVNSLIDAAAAEQKATVFNQIKTDLSDLRAQELQFLLQITTGQRNCQYDAGQLDQLLRELGVYGNQEAYQNLGELIGKEITDSQSYLSQNDTILKLYRESISLNKSDIPRFIEQLEGTSGAYYNAMIVADEIQRNADYLRSLSDEDFETESAEYKEKLDNCMVMDYALNTVQLQMAWAEHNRGVQTLQALRDERSPGSSDVLVEWIDLILTETQELATGLELKVGDTCQLEALAHPADATNREVTWQSNNPDAVTVSNQGLLTAVAEGTALITAASVDGNATVGCYVVVSTEGGGGGPIDPEIIVECESPEEEAQISLSYPVLQVSGSIEAKGKAITGFEVAIRSHAAMQDGDYEGVIVEGIGPEVIRSDNRFSFSVDLSTFDDKYRVPGTGHDQGYQLMIEVRDEDYRFGTCFLTYYLVDGAVGDLIAAKAAANTKVQANYTTASWAILTTALALPETTLDEMVEKTVAINNAIAGLVSVTSGGGSSGGGSSSSGAPATPTTPPTTTNPPTTTDGTTTASTSTTAALDSATGKATAPVSTTAMEAMITQAKTAEAAGQKAVVEIKVEAAPEAKAVEIAIPKTSIMNLATETQANVTVNTALATVTFDNKVLQTINNAASTGDVSISVASVDAGSLSPQALAVVADRPVYNFSVKAGDTEISSFEGGKARLSIPYTPKPGEKEEAIVVYYIDNNQNLIAVRGAFNPATNTVDFETTHFSRYAIGYNDVSFEDVKDTDWYSNAIGFLAARDIVKGVESGRFGPIQQMTRGQFVVMMMKAYGIDPEQNPTINFADAGNTYYTNYLAAAKNLKIVSGIGDNMYAPERFITRQEMFTMLYNALKVIKELPEGSGDKNLESFSDADGIASWAKPAIKLFVETGTVSGSDGLLRPLATSSRAEMAQVLYNLLHG